MTKYQKARASIAVFALIIAFSILLMGCDVIKRRAEHSMGLAKAATETPLQTEVPDAASHAADVHPPAADALQADGAAPAANAALQPEKDAAPPAKDAAPPAAEAPPPAAADPPPKDASVPPPAAANSDYAKIAPAISRLEKYIYDVYLYVLLALVALAAILLVAIINLSLLLLNRKKLKKLIAASEARVTESVAKIITGQNSANGSSWASGRQEERQDQENFKKDYDALKAKQSDLENRHGDLESRVTDLRNNVSRQSREIDALNSLTAGERAVSEAKKSGNNDPVYLFNLWAANPNANLPSAFYYVSEDLKARVEQTVTETFRESKWIVNRAGPVKYVFPNPKYIDHFTEMPLYPFIDTKNMKPRGQNKIEIIEACEMMESGCINRPGKLNLL